MSQLNRKQRPPSRTAGEFRPSQSLQNPRLESAIQQNGGSSRQLRVVPSRITLAENPTLAKEIQELIDKSRKSPAEAVTSPSHHTSIHQQTIDNGSSTTHTLQPNDDYVPRDWSLEDAQQAFVFEKTFKLLMVRLEDSPITEMKVKELGSSIRNVFVLEPILPRYVF